MVIRASLSLPAAELKVGYFNFYTYLRCSCFAFSRVGISGLMTLFELLSILAIILYFTMFFPLLKEALKFGVLGALQTLNSLMTKCNVARK